MKRLAQDQNGSTSVLIALLLPVMIGFVGLGIDVGLWYKQASLAQNAADNAALSAAVGGDGEIALAVASAYHFHEGVHGVRITVEQLRNKQDDPAIAVEIERPTPRLFSRMFLQQARPIRVRAVAERICGKKADCRAVLIE